MFQEIVNISPPKITQQITNNEWKIWFLTGHYEHLFRLTMRLNDLTGWIVVHAYKNPFCIKSHSNMEKKNKHLWHIVKKYPVF